MLIKHRKNLVYLLILILPFCLFFTRPKFLGPLKFKIIEITSIPIKLFSTPILEIKKIIYYHRIFDEYKRLKQEVTVLKSRLVGLEEVIHENNRYEKLLEFKRKLLYSSEAANVIGRDPSQWNSTMIIDKGQQDGIRQGMPVVNASGVIGKIAEVGSRASKVILVTDPQFSVAALIQRTRDNGIVSGTLQGNCRLRYLNPETELQLGDKVITSKLSSSFPEGLIIGEISQIFENPNNSTFEYILEPAVSLSEIEEVLVILGK